MKVLTNSKKNLKLNYIETSNYTKNYIVEDDPIKTIPKV